MRAKDRQRNRVAESKPLEVVLTAEHGQASQQEFAGLSLHFQKPKRARGM